MKKKGKNIALFLIFLLGLLIALYPLVSRLYYSYQGDQAIKDYQTQNQQLSSYERDERVQSAYAYNASLISENIDFVDPYSEEEKEEGSRKYAEMIELNEKIGVVTIPSINVELPIYAGTSEQVLQKAVGHLEGTSLPVGGINSHSVITAHRGLPENKLFTDLDKVEKGDLFYVETVVGKLAYKVVEIKVIEPTDINELTIQENRDLVTLLTCTPYMINSHRLLVIGERTSLPEEIDQVSWLDKLLDLLADNWWLILIALFFIVIILKNRRKQ